MRVMPASLTRLSFSIALDGAVYANRCCRNEFMGHERPTGSLGKHHQRSAFGPKTSIHNSTDLVGTQRMGLASEDVGW